MPSATSQSSALEQVPMKHRTLQKRPPHTNDSSVREQPSLSIMSRSTLRAKSCAAPAYSGRWQLARYTSPPTSFRYAARPPQRPYPPLRARQPRGNQLRTVLTKCDPHWGSFFHYDQDRTLTVREAARLQSFPDTFRFFGSRVSQYEQVAGEIPNTRGSHRTAHPRNAPERLKCLIHPPNRFANISQPHRAKSFSRAMGLIGSTIYKMPLTISEIFGYGPDDNTPAVQKIRRTRALARSQKKSALRPFVMGHCHGTCTVKPPTSDEVICCPKRLYAENYKILREVAVRAFGPDVDLIPPKDVTSPGGGKRRVVAFGSGWGKKNSAYQNPTVPRAATLRTGSWL